MTSLDTLLGDQDFREFVRLALAGIQGGQQIEGSVDNWTLDVLLRLALEQGDPPIGWFYIPESDDRLRIETIHGGNPYAWVAGLVEAFFEEIRNIICENNELKRVTKTAEFSAKGVATALAAWLGQRLGFSEPFAIAGAAVVLLVLADATRGAFCKMTKRQTLDKVGHVGSGTPPEIEG